jgi:hypothetical protein
VAFRSHVRRFEGSAKMHYLEVPHRVFERLGGKFGLRLVAEVPGIPKFHCALMPLGRGRACLYFSQEKLKLTGLREGSPTAVAVVRDRSRYGMKLPRELASALRLDPAGRKRFDALSPGKQRNLIFHVTSTKNPERRVDVAVQLLEDLKSLPPGKESVSELMRLDAARRRAARGEVDASEVVPRTSEPDEDFLSKFLPMEAR